MIHIKRMLFKSIHLDQQFRAFLKYYLHPIHLYRLLLIVLEILTKII